MAPRINRAIELLSQDQAIYYEGAHSGAVLTSAQGAHDAGTWADYINIGMEHGAFDMTGLAAYMKGMVEAGPTRSGHRTPAVIVEAPVNGTDEIPANPGARRAWHPAVPGGIRWRGARLRRVLPLSAQHAGR
jgi:hypothetical protein